MAKLTKDQKRKKKLAERNKKSLAKSIKIKPREIKESFTISRLEKDKETGKEVRVEFIANAEKANVVVNQDKLCDGRIVELKSNIAPLVTAWDYFGIAATNYIHAAHDECDRLTTMITPNEIEGVVVSFPDYDDEPNFNTNRILISCELDPTFNFSEVEKVKKFEDWFNEQILPFLSDNPRVESINSDYKMRSYHIIKAFGKYWAGSLMMPSSQLKQFEKKSSKKLKIIHDDCFEAQSYINKFENIH